MWKEIFGLIFRIEPASGNLIVDLLLPMMLSQLFYQVTYSIVGNLYSEGIIESSSAGSAIHWFLRLGAVYVCVLVFNLMFAFLPVIVGVISIVVIAWLILTKIIKK
jgi:hypothetical protein